MKRVNVMLFNEEKGLFCSFEKMELGGIPSIGEKIMYQEESDEITPTYVYTVVDVIFRQFGAVDVLVANKTDQQDYLHSFGHLVSTQYSK